jgi:hypothetical protein
MSSSLKQLIYNALIKASTPAHGVEHPEYATSKLARDAYIALVMADLFPEEKKEEETPAPKSPKKAKEPSSPKKTKEQKEAEKAAAKEAAKAAKEAEKAAAKEAKEAEKAAAKEAKSPKKPSEATVEAAKIPLPPSPPEQSPKKKVVRKPKAEKPATDANIQKIDPTWRKTLKEAADKDKAKELEPELLKYLNNMSNIAFNSKGAKDHVADFLATLAKPADDKIETELECVNFNGKEYYVNPETKRVYEGEMDDEGVLKVTRPVGYVGMADFKDMEC